MICCCIGLILLILQFVRDCFEIECFIWYVFRFRKLLLFEINFLWNIQVYGSTSSTRLILKMDFLFHYLYCSLSMSYCPKDILVIILSSQLTQLLIYWVIRLCNLFAFLSFWTRSQMSNLKSRMTGTKNCDWYTIFIAVHLWIWPFGDFLAIFYLPVLLKSSM